MLLMGGLLCGVSPVFGQSHSPVRWSASFPNQLIYITLPIQNDEQFVFYTDTGGKNFLYKSALKKLKIRKSKVNLWNDKLEKECFVLNGLPTPKVPSFYFLNESNLIEDGMLGREWFADRIWQINYSDSTFGELTAIPNEFSYLEPLQFLKNESFENINHLPRISTIIDGDSLSLLLDTGAQVRLSDEAKITIKNDDLVATSFVCSSLFQKWHREHPEWIFIAKGDKENESDMLQVPQITIGRQTIGPVWFVERADESFQIMSDLFMDRPIQGALGGNALSLFGEIILDYKQEMLLVK